MLFFHGGVAHYKVVNVALYYFNDENTFNSFQIIGFHFKKAQTKVYFQGNVSIFNTLVFH